MLSVPLHCGYVDRKTLFLRHNCSVTLFIWLLASIKVDHVQTLIKIKKCKFVNYISNRNLNKLQRKYFATF